MNSFRPRPMQLRRAQIRRMQQTSVVIKYDGDNDHAKEYLREISKHELPHGSQAMASEYLYNVQIHKGSPLSADNIREGEIVIEIPPKMRDEATTAHERLDRARRAIL